MIGGVPASLWHALARSSFRSRFRLGPRERRVIERHGTAGIARHAADFIQDRLAPACPANDGRQTPMRGHPVFVAQHATATCCRACLARWHGIAAEQALSADEQRYIRDVVMAWIGRQPCPEPEPTRQRLLF